MPPPTRGKGDVQQVLDLLYHGSDSAGGVMREVTRIH